MSKGKQLQKMPASLPVTGQEVRGMEKFDLEVREFMKHWQIPGGSIAIVYKGKPVYTRGFGYADFSAGKTVEPDSLFRLGSIAKILTAVATLKLIDEGKLQLNSKVVPILNYPLEANPIRSRDSRLGMITVQHCLESSGGWDRAHNGDPMFVPIVQQAALEYSNSLRPTPQAIIRYQFARPLDFTPGTRHCYSNLEYSMLGEVIAKTTGKTYPEYVQQQILAPMGIKRMVPGKTREFAPGEVSYYGFPGENLGPSVYPNIRGQLPLEYGGDFYLEAMTADCGWVSSTADMARFVSCVFGDCGTKLQPLSPKLTSLMIARPALKDWEGLDAYFAMGWEIKNAGSKKDMLIKKDGCLPGSAAVALHKPDGISVVAAFNSRPRMALEFQDEIVKLIEKGLALKKCW